MAEGIWVTTKKRTIKHARTPKTRCRFLFPRLTALATAGVESCKPLGGFPAGRNVRWYVGDFFLSVRYAGGPDGEGKSISSMMRFEETNGCKQARPGLGTGNTESWGACGRHLSLGMSSKVAIDGPFEAVLGKTRRTEF